jgi:thiaminase
MSARFTDELWRGSADIYGAILAHPFLAGLATGELAALTHQPGVSAAPGS